MCGRSRSDALTSLSSRPPRARAGPHQVWPEAAVATSTASKPGGGCWQDAEPFATGNEDRNMLLAADWADHKNTLDIAWMQEGAALESVEETGGALLAARAAGRKATSGVHQLIASSVAPSSSKCELINAECCLQNSPDEAATLPIAQGVKTSLLARQPLQIESANATCIARSSPSDAVGCLGDGPAHHLPQQNHQAFASHCVKNSEPPPSASAVAAAQLRRRPSSAGSRAQRAHRPQVAAMAHDVVAEQSHRAVGSQCVKRSEPPSAGAVAPAQLRRRPSSAGSRAQRPQQSQVVVMTHDDLLARGRSSNSADSGISRGFSNSRCGNVQRVQESRTEVMENVGAQQSDADVTDRNASSARGRGLNIGGSRVCQSGTDRRCGSVQRMQQYRADATESLLAHAQSQPQMTSSPTHQEAVCRNEADAEFSMLQLEASPRVITSLGNGGANDEKKIKNIEMALRNQKQSKREMMAPFRYKTNVDAKHKIFALDGPDDHIRKALLCREPHCVENCVRGSVMWDLKWCTTDCERDYRNLQEGDLYNHFQFNRELTTKAGLAQNLQRFAASELVDVDRFFPRSYDMSFPTEREDFILDFRRSAALNVGLQHLRLSSQRESRSGASRYMCNVGVLRTAARALDDWLRALDGSHLDEEAITSRSSFRHIDAESWDALVLYSEVGDAQLCQLEGCEQKRERNRGFSVSGSILEPPPNEDLSSSRRATKRPVDVQAWPEFCGHQWLANAPKELYDSLHTSVCTIKTQWSQIDAHGPRNVWIVKPGTNSKASGITCKSSLPEVLHHCKAANRIVQKYVERPLLLLGGRKFDIRQWVLVRSFVPLEAYMFSECYLRLCNAPFDLGDLANRQRHISNWSVNKHGKHVQEGALASLSEFCTVLDEITDGPNYWQLTLQPKLSDIILHSLRAVQHQVTQRAGCFELYGFDFLIDEKLNPWLLEVNLSPACESRTPWISDILKRMSSRLIDIVLDGRTEPDGLQPDWIRIAGQSESCPESNATAIERDDLFVAGRSVNCRAVKRFDDALQKFEGILLIQRVLRGHLVRQRRRQERQSRAIQHIHAVTRTWLIRRRLMALRSNEAACHTQCCIRRFFAIKFQVDLTYFHHAAVLQRKWRRRVFLKKQCAVSILVRWWRRKFVALRQQQVISALRLQAMWRGAKARRRCDVFRIHVEKPARKLALIIALLRWRHLNVWSSMQVAAHRLQVYWRHLIQRRILFYRLNKRIVQRTTLKAWQHHLTAGVFAASKLQRFWRAVSLRLRFNKARVACKLIQRAWQLHRARGKRRLRIDAAAVKLQSALRRWIVQRFRTRALRGAILLQAAWRRTLACHEVSRRRRFHERRYRWLAAADDNALDIGTPNADTSHVRSDQQFLEAQLHVSQPQAAELIDSKILESPSSQVPSGAASNANQSTMSALESSSYDELEEASECGRWHPHDEDGKDTQDHFSAHTASTSELGADQAISRVDDSTRVRDFALVDTAPSSTQQHSPALEACNHDSPDGLAQHEHAHAVAAPSPLTITGATESNVLSRSGYPHQGVASASHVTASFFSESHVGRCEFAVGERDRELPLATSDADNAIDTLLVRDECHVARSAMTPKTNGCGSTVEEDKKQGNSMATVFPPSPVGSLPAHEMLGNERSRIAEETKQDHALAAIFPPGAVENRPAHEDHGIVVPLETSVRGEHNAESKTDSGTEPWAPANAKQNAWISEDRVVVRSESGTSLSRRRVSTTTPSYPPVSLLAAPCQTWIASPREPGGLASSPGQQPQAATCSSPTMHLRPFFSHSSPCADQHDTWPPSWSPTALHGSVQEVLSPGRENMPGSSTKPSHVASTLHHGDRSMVSQIWDFIRSTEHSSRGRSGHPDVPTSGPSKVLPRRGEGNQCHCPDAAAGTSKVVSRRGRLESRKVTTVPESTVQASSRGSALYAARELRSISSDSLGQRDVEQRTSPKAARLKAAYRAHPWCGRKGREKESSSQRRSGSHKPPCNRYYSAADQGTCSPKAGNAKDAMEAMPQHDRHSRTQSPPCNAPGHAARDSKPLDTGRTCAPRAKLDAAIAAAAGIEVPMKSGKKVAVVNRPSSAKR